MTNVCPSTNFLNKFHVGCGTNCTATEKTCVPFCVLIGAKTVTINANPMRLVQSILYWPCTRRIGFAPIVTILSPIKTKDFTHVFFLLLYNLYHRLQEIHEKKHTTDRRLFTKPVILERMKLDSAVRHYCLSQKIKCTCRKLSWWRSL